MGAHMKVIAVAVLALAGFLAGCAETGAPVRSTDGQNVGNADKRDITPGESPFSIDGGRALNPRYSQRSFSTRTSTTAEFRDGFLIYEVSGTNAAFGLANDTSLRHIDSMIAPHLSKIGLTADRSTLKRGRTRIGNYAMIAATGSGRSCWMFQQYPEAYLQFYDNGGFYKAYLAGFFCGAQGASLADAEAGAKRFLESLHLDNGALNRAQLPGA